MKNFFSSVINFFLCLKLYILHFTYIYLRKLLTFSPDEIIKKRVRCVFGKVIHTYTNKALYLPTSEAFGGDLTRAVPPSRKPVKPANTQSCGFHQKRFVSSRVAFLSVNSIFSATISFTSFFYTIFLWVVCGSAFFYNLLRWKHQQPKK